MLENTVGGGGRGRVVEKKKDLKAVSKLPVPTDSELQNQWEKLKGRGRVGTPPPPKCAAASTAQLSCSLCCYGLFYTMLVLGAVYSKAENTVIKSHPVRLGQNPSRYNFKVV